MVLYKLAGTKRCHRVPEKSPQQDGEQQVEAGTAALRGSRLSQRRSQVDTECPSGIADAPSSSAQCSSTPSDKNQRFQGLAARLLRPSTRQNPPRTQVPNQVQPAISFEQKRGLGKLRGDTSGAEQKGK
uniref:Uncharacterized protein n=1 Tax=Tetraselmis sp. GSL018 TaxID=582737 RepID=A0A061RN27_9CHLO|eukprot:CAMPEP_0177623546 /NCGR_PEP_ID=MMETSP0419_2-20121207/28961_1 /TAXON_ID=582737 /ORGANISM="Tetraselmis sp., Strain GSL018" /LENGTH=128 /DNA_ID=CAMNT_0019124107 /DNA_START=79 /DNA_END=465 /DNA_ORIENTATION=-